ncbi:MAG: toxin-antitoxin system YwqK family antitoxin [Flavobacteriia bacterium]
MKNLLLFLIIAFQGFSQNAIDSNGKKQGPWSKLYPGTKVYQYKGQFKDDKPVGTFMYYYQSSKLKAIVKHIDGTNRSDAQFYHENGVIMSKGIYINLKKDSVWSNFGPSGRLSNKETYKADLLHGKKTIFFVPEDPNDKSQIISSVSNYREGVLEGEFIEYFDSGSIKEKGNYLNGKKSGFWMKYSITGSIMIEECFKEGLRNGWTKSFDESGKEVGKQYYLQGRVIKGKELEVRLNQIKKQAAEGKSN